MARTALTPVSPGTTGLNLDDEAVAAELTDGNSYPWSPRRHLYVNNGDDAALTVTIPTPATVGPLGLDVDDAEFTVPAGEHLLLPAMGVEARQANGLVYVNWSGDTPTGVTVCVVDL